MLEIFERLQLPEERLIFLILGILLLLLGQRMVVLLIATAAFYITAQAAKKYFGDAAPSTVLAVSLLAAIAVGVFTKMFRNIAIGIAGYTIAGFVLSSHASSWGIEPENERFVFVIGGVLGSLLISFAMDLGLRVISSVLGAVLVVQYFPLEPTTSRWLALLLAVVGFLIQSGIVQALKKGAKK